SFGGGGRGREDGGFGVIGGFDSDYELGFSGDDGVAVGDYGGRDALAIEPGAVTAVEVAEAASVVYCLYAEVRAGHVGIVGESEVGTFGAADAHKLAGVEADSVSGLRSGANFEKNRPSVGGTGGLGT